MEKTLRGDVFMRIWNRDGSSAEACGNATRCVACHHLGGPGGAGFRIDNALLDGDGAADCCVR